MFGPSTIRWARLTRYRRQCEGQAAVRPRPSPDDLHSKGSPSLKALLAGLLVAGSLCIGGLTVQAGHKRSPSCHDVRLQAVGRRPGLLHPVPESRGEGLDLPAFFPIGVWFESVSPPGDIALDEDAGLNTYVVLTDTSQTQFGLVDQAGMSMIVTQYLRSLPPVAGRVVRGRRDRHAHGPPVVLTATATPTYSRSRTLCGPDTTAASS